jgi:hypothetical protein
MFHTLPFSSFPLPTSLAALLGGQAYRRDDCPRDLGLQRNDDGTGLRRRPACRQVPVLGGSEQRFYSGDDEDGHASDAEVAWVRAL